MADLVYSNMTVTLLRFAGPTTSAVLPVLPETLLLVTNTTSGNISLSSSIPIQGGGLTGLLRTLFPGASILAACDDGSAWQILLTAGTIL